jgi:hypothetical protein
VTPRLMPSCASGLSVEAFERPQSLTKPMNRTYDIFERQPDGKLLWKSSVQGHEAAVSKLRELASGSPNEWQLIHVPTQSLVATMNGLTLDSGNSPQRPTQTQSASHAAKESNKRSENV